MNRASSLRRRLGVGLALGVTVMWVVATVAAGIVVRHKLDKAFDSALQETAQRLLSLAVVDIVKSDNGARSRRVLPLKRNREFLTYLIRNQLGTVLLQSHDSNLAIFPKMPILGFRSTVTHRIYGEAAISGSIIIEVAEPLEHRRKAVFEAAAALFLPLVFLIPVSLLGVWWFVRRSMEPVLAFKGEIELRGEGNLSPIAVVTLPAEIGPIADSVNRLMERLRRALEAERGFAANSAHELRTMIAATLAQTQRLVTEAATGAVWQRACGIEASLRRLARLAEKLMQLARAEGGCLLSEEPQNLVLILAHVVEEFCRALENPDYLRLASPTSGVFESTIDPDAFAILMRNLIENALKHGRLDRPVMVTMSDTGVIRVVNAGPVLDAALLEQIKTRFKRGPSKANGSGLGLAIVDAITRFTGATIDLRSPATGQSDGFEATLDLGPSAKGKSSA